MKEIQRVYELHQQSCVEEVPRQKSAHTKPGSDNLTTVLLNLKSCEP